MWQQTMLQILKADIRQMCRRRDSRRCGKHEISDEWYMSSRGGSRQKRKWHSRRCCRHEIGDKWYVSNICGSRRRCRYEKQTKKQMVQQTRYHAGDRWIADVENVEKASLTRKLFFTREETFRGRPPKYIGALTLIELVFPCELPWTAVVLSTCRRPTCPRRLNSSECHSPRLKASVVVSRPGPVPQLNMTLICQSV